MNIKQYFMSNIKKKGYLQGKLLKPVYQERLKAEKKDPISFCNRFAEEVGKECIKSQIIAVGDEIQKLESEIQKKRSLIVDLEHQKELRIQEISKNYDHQVQQLKERKKIFLAMDYAPLEKLLEISAALDSRVGRVSEVIKELGDKYSEELTQLLDQAKSVANSPLNEEQKACCQEVKALVDEQIRRDFSFPEIREAGKQLGLLFLLFMTLVIDGAFLYGMLTDILVEVENPIPYASEWVVFLTVVLPLALMLFFRFIQLKKEVGGEMKYDPKAVFLLITVCVIIVLLIGMSIGEDWGEVVLRIFMIPALYIGEVILEKIDWNVVFDMFKKIRLIPVKVQEYLGYVLGKRKLEKEQGNIQSELLKKGFDANILEKEGDEKSEYKKALNSIFGAVNELKDVSAYMYSTYEMEIRDYQDLLSKIEKDKAEAIKLGTAELSKQITKVEDGDIQKLEAKIQIYRQKINERIQEASQGVLEGLTE